MNISSADKHIFPENKAALLLTFILWLTLSYSLSLLMDFTGNYTLLLVFTAIYAFIALTALKLVFEDNKADLLSPLVFFSCINFLYILAGALSILKYNIGAYGERFGQHDISLYLMYCLVGFTSACTGFCAGNLPRLPHTTGLTKRFDPANMAGKMLLITLPLAILGWKNHLAASFDFLHAKTYVEAALSARLTYRAAGASAGILQVFLQQVPLTAILVIIGLIFFNSHSKTAKIFAAALLTAHVATVLRGGGRSLLAMLVLIAVTLYHYKVRPIKFKHFALVILGGYTMLPIMSIARSASKPLEMPAVVAKSWKLQRWEIFNIANNGEFVASQTFMRLIILMESGEAHPLRLDGIKRTVAVFIPRVVLPNRPTPLTELFTQKFYPDIWAKGGGVGFFNLIEGFWIAGVPGIVLFAFLYAMIVQYIYRLFREHTSSVTACIWYALILNAVVITAVRTGLILTTKSALMVSIPFVAALALPDLNFFKRIGNAIGIQPPSGLQ